jgi:hypothetical protein
MDTALAYLISVGIIAFGIWTVAAAAPGSSVFLFWIVGGLLTIAVGLLSLFGEVRNHGQP